MERVSFMNLDRATEAYYNPANPWIIPRKIKNIGKSSLFRSQKEIVSSLFYDDFNFNEDEEKGPPDCPPGLAALHSENETLIVMRRPENGIRLEPEERLQAFSQYDVVTSDGNQIFVGAEDTTARSVKWQRDARLSTISLYNQNSNKVLTIKRKGGCGFCFAQYCCLCCLWGFKGCGNHAVVRDKDNKPLGYISQRLSLTSTQIVIKGEKKRKLLSIHGNLKNGIFDIISPKHGDLDPIGMIETAMTAQEVSAFYKVQVSPFEDPYGLTFYLPSLPVRDKALLISAIILMDFIFLKPNSDYPSLYQFIPGDFKLDEALREKVFRDESKEIIITSIRPKQSRINKLRGQRTCGCCRWFCGILCLCCPLGVARNRCRCYLLAVTWLILILALGAGVVLYILIEKKIIKI